MTSANFSILVFVLSLALLGCRSDSQVDAEVDLGTDQSTDLTDSSDANNTSNADLSNDDSVQDDGVTVLSMVQILAPEDGAVVSNPVTFQVETSGVAMVQILAEDWPLSEPWDPAAQDTLVYMFEGVGFERRIVLLGFNENDEEVARHELRMTVESPLLPLGTLVGTFYNTYYYLAEETAYGGSPTAKLYSRSGTTCNVIATVSSNFANAACIEGSARLADGRVINYAAPCSCGGPCSYCWSVLNPATHPWGMGSRGNALEPLRSWATDKDVIPYGTVLYVEEWDGLQIPAVDDLGGFVHDGCFRADDVGGAINGNHVDIFSGSKNLWPLLEAIFPTRTNFKVYKDSPRCAHL